MGKVFAAFDTSITEDVNIMKLSLVYLSCVLLGAIHSLSMANESSDPLVNTGNSLASANPTELNTPAEDAATNTSAPSPLALAYPQRKSAVSADYLDAIASMEQEFGPYYNQLSEQLLTLGVNYQNQGMHEEASEVFKRAMHVSRVNEGLYSLNQVPILERLIESTVASGDWEAASDSHQYLYWLHRRNFGEDDPRMLPVITKLSNWHLNAYSLDIGSGLFQHLISAHNLYTLAINIIDRVYGQDDMRLVGALKGLTVSNYYLATYQASAAQRTDFETSFGSARASADERARLEQYILNSYSSGKNAIARIQHVYATNPQAPVAAEVQAQIQLADWNLMFNRWHTAIDMYQQAYNQLASTPDAETMVNKFFGSPVALPDLPLLQAGTESEDQSNEYVLVSFDVSKHGRARNIEILEAFPEDSVRNRSHVRKALKTTKFRPRFADGSPTDTENLTHRYVFSDSE